MIHNGFQKYCTVSYVLTNLIILFLIVIGVVLIAVDLTYMRDWVYGFRLADFYTYLVLIGIISGWSVYGLGCSLTGSSKGMSIYTIGLSVLIVIHLIVGCVHIIMLFLTYEPILMNTCLQTDSSRYFWWSLGYEETKEMKEILSKCTALWRSFSTERLISWVVYSCISFICLYFIHRYRNKLRNEYRLAQGMMMEDQKDDWSSEHVEANTKDAGIVYHNEEFPSTEEDKENALSASMHQQRQRLYEEIAKRKRAKKNLNRKSIAQNPNRNSILVVHPLDLSRDPENYEPPPMPSPPKEKVIADEEKSWNRYDTTIDKDEMDIEREKKLKTLSSERMEYEMYCSTDPAPSTNRQRALDDDHEAEEKGVSHRKRPKSGRWSALYPNDMNPLTAIQQNETPDTEEDEENKHLLQ